METKGSDDVRTHRDLDVWRAAIELAKNVYEFTKKFPKEEAFGLVSQMRRCAVSIASNIAEGAGRNGRKEFLKFLYIALGSVNELDTQLEISEVTGTATGPELKSLHQDTTRVKMMLNGLIRSLKKQSTRT